jgi:hypothetical protein
MANINQINVKVKTGNKGVVSGTNGDVYLGIGGRGFTCLYMEEKIFERERPKNSY